MAGFFGVSSKSACLTDVFYGTDYHSHLGTRKAGIATFNQESGEFCRSIHSISGAPFRTKFEDELGKFQGNSGMGIISDTDAQPLLINSHLGRFAICTVAKILNLQEIADELLAENMHLSEFSSGRINPTELAALLIIKGKTFKEGIEYLYKRVKGSCSLLLLTEDGIIAARDSWGRTPIVVGKKEGAYAVASESTAFTNLGYTTDYFVGPGEIVKITADEMLQLRKPSDRMQICAFLWVYYGFPTSDYEGRNTEVVRNATGEAMGKSDDTEVDCVCGIPDSGIGMAVGYADGAKVPYKRAITKYTPTWPRSFMPTRQEMRDLVAKMKLIHNSSMLKDQRVLFCDDSIVRGTQLKDNTRCLFAAGAKEVHMRIASPPLLYGCQFLNFTNSKSDMELITRRFIAEFEGDAAAQDPERIKAYAVTGSPEYERMVGAIRDRFGLTSLKYTKLEDLVEAIGLPKCKICTHCFDGTSAFTLEETNV